MKGLLWPEYSTEESNKNGARQGAGSLITPDLVKDPCEDFDFYSEKMDNYWRI